jgi:light-regulated signal transduction histidine kinase (bacteriophytochrome)
MTEPVEQRPPPAGPPGADALRLAQEVNALRSELARLRQESQTLLYSLAHDLQRPMRHARSFAEILQRHCGATLDAESAHYLDRIVSAGQEGQAMLDGLLQVSRVVSRGAPLEPTDSAAAFDAARARLAERIRQAGAQVGRGALPVVTADPSQLQELFERLLDNALKFRRPDVPPVVDVSAERVAPPGAEAAGWRFRVRDNGIGVDPKSHDRIFTLFQRLHTAAEYPGVGLGLAVCKHIVERHGGRIGVESQAGQGAVFFFTLPDAAPPASA